MNEHTTFVIPTERLAAVVAAFSLQTGPSRSQPTDTAPKPSVGESQTPRWDGMTRSEAIRPQPAASTLQRVPTSAQDTEHSPGQGATTPHDSDADSILGPPR
jgi:guanyl-specific ribonuclease Sa